MRRGAPFDAQAVRRRLPADLRRARAAVVARPPVVTIVLIVCITVTFIRLQVGVHLPTLIFLADAYSPRALTQGHGNLIVTSSLLTRDIFMLVSISYSLLFALGTYEVLAGHLRAILMIAFGAVLGPVVVTAGLGVLVAAGSGWAEGRLGTLDIGASAIIACASAGVAGLARNRLFTIGLILFLIGGLLVHHRLADWEHTLIFPFGYWFGRLVGRPRPRPVLPAMRRAAVYVVGGTVLLALGLAGCSRVLPVAAVQRSADGTVLSPARVVDTNYSSVALGDSQRRVLILLPAGYDSTHNRYPVIELLHGHPGRPDDLLSLGNVQQTMSDKGIGPFIAVIPDGNGPRHDDSWFANIPSQRMGTAVTTDLRPWVAKNYRITGSWSYAGLSSGGFGAAYLPLVDTQPIHAVCGLSGYYTGAHVPLPAGTPQSVRNRYAPIRHLSREPGTTFLAYGRSDPKTKAEALAYYHALRRVGKRAVLQTYPGKHQWAVWRPAFADCFRLLAPASGAH